MEGSNAWHDVDSIMGNGDSDGDDDNDEDGHDNGDADDADDADDERWCNMVQYGAIW